MQYIYLFIVFLCLISTSVVSGNLEDGLNFYKSNNFSEAFLLLEPLAINGNAEAQTYLGYMYDFGEGVSEDNNKAVYWYKRAADQGHIDAQYYLGTMYDLGEGVSEDNNKAVYWYRLAADQGHEWAIEDVRSFDKFFIESSTISYQTGEFGISPPDHHWLKDILNANPNIKNLNLNSLGGSFSEAFLMSEIIIEFNLNTKVVGSCFSSCTIIFLAGNKRSMENGSKLGFHQTMWKIQELKRFYQNNAEYYSWNDQFEFAAWIYNDSQKNIYKYLNFLLERGVDPIFAIQSIRETPDEMWLPTLDILKKSLVIN